MSKEVKEKMYNEFMQVFFHKWWLHTVDNNGDNHAYIDFEFSLEPYMEYVTTVNPSALRIFFVRDAKAKMVAIKSIEIKDNVVYVKATYDDTLIKEEMEKNSYKYMSFEEQAQYDKKQNSKKNSWRNIKIGL